MVLTGGGARAAYQIGFLAALCERFPGFAPDIVTGVSAGAINAAFVANSGLPFARAIPALEQLWSDLTTEDVFRARFSSMSRLALRWAVRLSAGGRLRTAFPEGLLDTAPLRSYLERVLETRDGVLTRVDDSLDSGRLSAVALTATSYTTGQSYTFFRGRGIENWERPNRLSRQCALTVDHVLASSALPLLFPAVKLEQGWFGDGGVRLTAPLAPAIHLGARRILAVSTRFGRSRREASEPVIDGYPPPATIAGVLLNAVFLDHLDGDAAMLTRVNRLIERLPEERRAGLRPVELEICRPSRDLGKLANECEAQLPRALRFLSRGAGTLESRSNDFLSLIMFQHDYVQRLLDLGRVDAEDQLERFARWLEQPVRGA